MSIKIKNITGLSASDLQEEADNGARFIYYPYTVSLVFATFKRTSGVYLIRKNENTASRRTWFSIISALFGWWGIPFGPRYTLEAIRTNLAGGKDVTDEVMSTVAGFVLFREAEQKRKIAAR